MKNNNVDELDVDQFFQIEAGGDDLKLMKEIKKLQEEYETLESDYKKKGKELNRLKIQLADSWSVKQIKSMEVDGYKFKLEYFEKFSITKKGESDEVKQERIRALEPFFIKLGLHIVKHKAVDIHHVTLNSTFGKLINPKGEFKLDLQEILDAFPFVNHYAGSIIKVEKVK